MGQNTVSVQVRDKMLKQSIKLSKLIHRARYGRFSLGKTKQAIGLSLIFILISNSIVPRYTVAYEPAEEAIIAVSSSPISTEAGTAQPLDEITVNQGYRLFHPGIDYEGETGDKVATIMAGKVKKVQHSSLSYGNAIIVDHGNKTVSLYAHLSEITVSEGQEVAKGEIIGAVGSTGRSTGSHLHLEVSQEGKTLNPLSILPEKTV